MVDFPQPEAPTRATLSPCLTVKLRCRYTCRYRMETHKENHPVAAHNIRLAAQIFAYFKKQMDGLIIRHPGVLNDGAINARAFSASLAMVSADPIVWPRRVREVDAIKLHYSFKALTIYSLSTRVAYVNL